MKFIDPFYLVLGQNGLLLFCGRIFHRQLVEVWKQFVVFKLHLRIVSHCHARLIVSEDLVLFNLGETTPAHYDATALVLVDLIIRDMIWTIKDYDTIRIVINVIVLNPTEACFNCEDALWPRLINQVVQDHRVCRIVATIGDVGLVILENIVLLNVSWSCVYEEDALAKITENLVV